MPGEGPGGNQHRDQDRGFRQAHVKFATEELWRLIPKNCRLFGQRSCAKSKGKRAIVAFGQPLDAGSNRSMDAPAKHRGRNLGTYLTGGAPPWLSSRLRASSARFCNSS